jgi:hypothetical protein
METAKDKSTNQKTGTAFRDKQSDMDKADNKQQQESGDRSSSNRRDHSEKRKKS